MKDRLLSGERLDDLQRDGLMIIQNPKWFCFGMDAVLLSSFANVPEGKKYWISDVAMASFQSFYPLRLKRSTSKDWKFRRTSRIWRDEALSIIN